MAEQSKTAALPGGLEVFTLAQRPDLESPVRALSPATLPEFILHDAVANRYWDDLYAGFADFQIAVCNEGEVIAAGYTIPISWDRTVKGLPGGWDAVLEQGNRDFEDGRTLTAVSALQAVVSPSHRGRGLSRVILEAMKSVAAKRGLGALIAPVRPTLKERYPLTPMERYVGWEREDGLPFDPWMRVHRRMGAEVLRVAPRSMLITGAIREWEGWTGLRFPESGEYVVPGALRPVVMDVEGDVGTYEEPNVWMRHAVEVL